MDTKATLILFFSSPSVSCLCMCRTEAETFGLLSRDSRKRERERESSVMTLGRNDGNDLRGKVGWWEKRGRIL